MLRTLFAGEADGAGVADGIFEKDLRARGKETVPVLE
jgi:hypothetical protein